LLVIWATLRGMTRWLLNHAGTALDIANAVNRYYSGMLTLRTCVATAITPRERQRYDADKRRWIDAGYPDAISSDLATLPTPGSALDIIHVAAEHNLEIERAAEVYFALGEALHLSWLMGKVEELPVESRWHAQARIATGRALRSTGRPRRSSSTAEKARARSRRCGIGVTIQLEIHADMFADMRAGRHGYPIVSVAVRAWRNWCRLIEAG
jgi:glutamate dehydrogenase